MRRLYSLKRLALVAAFCVVSIGMFAQQKTPNNLDPEVHKHPIKTAERHSVFEPTEAHEDWAPMLKNTRVIHEPGSNLQREHIEQLIEDANRRRAEGQIDKNPEGALPRSAALTPPIQGINYFGNGYDGSIPSDNALAVSTNGYVVSGTNSRVHMYDINETNLYDGSLSAFSNGAGGFNAKFDPKCTYDPVNNRFILAWLNGSSPNSSKIIVAFSSAEDPTQSWSIYQLGGNVTGSVWTDFIQLGISTDELFITGNLFNGSTSEGSAIWQIPLSEGYAGTTLNYQVYDTPYFSLHPVEGGSTMYGPNFYFIRTSSGGGNEVNLHEITNTIANGGVLNSPVGFTLNVGFAVSPSAEQKGSSTLLQCNDTRVQSSYFENNRIEFTLNSSVGGKPGFYHGTGVISPFLITFSSFTGTLIAEDDFDISYPAIAYGGAFGSQNASFIMFNAAGSGYYPGNGAIYISENGERSPMAHLRNGNSALSGGSQTRWGDYADIQERPGSPGEAWVGGSFGSGGTPRTYISQIFTPTVVANDVAVDPSEHKLTVFPNPVTDRVTFDFTVEEEGDYSVIVVDASGRMVKTIVANHLRPGEGRTAFDTVHLSSGTYFVQVKRDSEVMYSEKFVVNH